MTGELWANEANQDKYPGLYYLGGKFTDCTARLDFNEGFFYLDSEENNLNCLVHLTNYYNISKKGDSAFDPLGRVFRIALVRKEHTKVYQGSESKKVLGVVDKHLGGWLQENWLEKPCKGSIDFRHGGSLSLIDTGTLDKEILLRGVVNLEPIQDLKAIDLSKHREEGYKNSNRSSGKAYTSDKERLESRLSFLCDQLGLEGDRRTLPAVWAEIANLDQRPDYSMAKLIEVIFGMR